MLFKKLIRTMGVYKAQFISMIIMIALGVAIVVGFNIEWVSIDKNTKNFYEASGFADYRISTDSALSPFSKEDAEKIKNIDGVKEVSRYISVNCAVAGSDEKTLALTVTENPKVSYFLSESGEPYDENSLDGGWLSYKYATENNIKVGDSVKFSFSGYAFEVKVKGLVRSSEYLVCVKDETQLMPKFELHGFIYISPAMFKAVIKEKNPFITDGYFPQINVLSDMEATELKAAVDKALGKTTLVLTRDETPSYSLAQGEAEEGKTMGSILPVIFLLIAVLTMVTTMHRITQKEKVQIGTLKALGFKDKTIVLHYTSYALAIGLIGSVFGIGLGFLIGKFIFSEGGSMGTYLDMPSWRLYVPWFCWVIIVGMIAFLTFIGFLSVKKILKGTPADALRPYVPKKSKKLLLERTPLWNKLPFAAKWNLRDIMRHKSRSIMTLIGVVGCMVIIVGSFGMKDTMDGFVDSYYNTAMNYTSQIFVSDDAKKENVDTLIDKYSADYSGSVGVEYENKAYSVEVYSITHDKIRFLSDDSDATVTLPDDGAFVCRRIAEKYNLKAGDKIVVKPYGKSDKFTLTVKGTVRSQSERIVISKKYADSLGFDFEISSLYTDTDRTVIKNDQSSAAAAVKSIQDKKDIIDTFDTFFEIMNEMIILLVVVGAVLGIVVLYNLGTMSYSERYREMATLKVVGFKDKKIGRILIEQNVWLTVVGMIIGLPLGFFTLDYLVKALASEYEMRVTVGAMTYIAGVAITFGVSLLVGFLVARKNKKIDMVEALKGAE